MTDLTPESYRARAETLAREADRDLWASRDHVNRSTQERALLASRVSAAAALGRLLLDLDAAASREAPAVTETAETTPDRTPGQA